MATNKESWLGVRLTPTEHAIISNRAQNADLSISEYVRRKCSGDYTNPVIVTDMITLQKMHRNLKLAGSNLNQIARILNTRHNPTPQLLSELEEALASVESASNDISAFIADAKNNI